jgi:diguanylate cyclase (GGDEF)-like protein
MIQPPIPSDEPLRLQTLRALQLLDTPPEERFDRLTRLARRLFGVPIALISLVDEHRQWFKSNQGLAASETPREVSFCGHAILGNELFVVPDATLDLRFHDNPLVRGDPNVRFYAGYPLTVPNGSRLGTLCLIDVEPHTMSPEDLQLLQDLGRTAEHELAAVQLATIDELTMISNRRGFMSLGQHALNLSARRLDRPATLLFLDLDGFKQINDRFGHAEGDRALTSFASLLVQTFRDSDVVGRLGGDEFVVLVSNCDERQAGEAIDRLQGALDRHNGEARRGYALAFSVGAMAYDPHRHATIDALCAEADARMYERKLLKRMVS